MDDNAHIRQQAISFAQKNKKQLARELTDVSQFPPDTSPIAVFMAGSPGAGKTESARNLIQTFSSNGRSILRIDADDIREKLPGYNGHNSSLFQGATSIVADSMQDAALRQSQSYVFDGTLSNLDAARTNIQRNLKRRRPVFIVYVYQDPRQAWEFVKARERRDGRAVPKEAFIQQYFLARKNVHTLKKEFGSNVTIYLIIKNIDGSDFGYQDNADSIDNYIPERYSVEQLEVLLA